MIKFVAVAICGIVPVCLFGQAFRSDPLPSSTVGYAPPTAYPPILAIPGAAIAICNDSACTTRATTYTSATGTSTCPSTAQVVLAGGASCVANSDRRGNFGFWLNTGTYYYTITIGGVQYGPYPLSVGGSGGGGGGNVSGSGTAGFVPKWLSASAIGNSIMQDTGAAVGIGGTPDQLLTMTSSSTSGSVLHIVNTSPSGFGAIRFRNDTGSDVITLGLNNSGGGGNPQWAFSQPLSIFPGGNDTIWINPAGTADQFRIYGTGGFNVGSSSALPTPGSGYGKLWFDSTNLTFQAKNASGSLSTMVFAQTCGGSTVVNGVNASGTLSCVAGGGVGVTSVGLSLPGIFSVTGSPVTSTGTLTAALVNQNANTVFAGPSSGSAAAPGFRAMVLADLPAIASTNLTDSANLVRITTNNTYNSGTTQGFGNSNIVLPAHSSFVAGSSAMIGLDTVTLNFHLYTNNGDSLIATIPSLPTNGHCASWAVTSFQLQLADAGGACGSGGGGGSGNFPTVSTTGNTVLTIFPNCTTSGSPCTIGGGGIAYTQVSATATATSPASSGTAYIYWDTACKIASTTTITASGCTYVVGNAFPNHVYPIAVEQWSGGNWNTTPINVQPATNSVENVAAGTGLNVISDNGTTQTIGIDATVMATAGVAAAFSTLPACDASHFNHFAWINDGPVGPTWGAAVTVGGSTDTILLNCDGFGSWRVMGL